MTAGDMAVYRAPGGLPEKDRFAKQGKSDPVAAVGEVVIYHATGGPCLRDLRESFVMQTQSSKH